jgi:hypothetical protein
MDGSGLVIEAFLNTMLKRLAADEPASPFTVKVTDVVPLRSTVV